MSDEPAAARPLVPIALHLLLGPIVWALHLTVIYCGHVLLCTDGMTGSQPAILAATAIALAALATALSIAWSRRERGDPTTRFRNAVMGLLALLSTAGVAWAGGAALVVPSCA